MQVNPEDTISVIVVNYNRKALLRGCLESLLRQTDVSLEIIVVDNGSTDGSVEMVESLSASSHVRVKILQNRENHGFCKANNQGIAQASGAFIALLNNDAEAEPHWLRELRSAFRPGDGIGMAASKILVWGADPPQIDKAGHQIYLDGQNRGRGSGEPDRGQYDRMEEVLWPDGCAAMYRRSMLEQIGGFDEDFFAYADDAELGLRARIAGWGCLYIPTAVVRHRRGETLGLRSYRRVELIERNRVLLAIKLFPWYLVWLNGVFYAARLLAGLWAAMNNRGEISRYPGWRSKMRVGMALLRADLEALSMVPNTLRKRRQLRPLRRLTPSQITRLLWKNRISLKTLSQQSV